MRFAYIKIVSILSIFVSLAIAENKDINLNNFLDIDKNVSYLYKMTDMLEDNDKILKFTSKYMEKHLSKEKNNCIDIESYILYQKNDIQNLDNSLKSKLKENKLRTIDEMYCIKNNTIEVNGEVIVNLNKKWSIKIKKLYKNNTNSKATLVECKLIDISKKDILGKKREVIHTKCKSKYNEETDWYIAQNIGLYKFIKKDQFSVFHGKSKSEIVLIKQLTK